MHAIDNRQSLTVKYLIVAILETANVLLGERAWASVRRKYYVDKSSILDKHYYHYTDDTLPRETDHVFDELLQPAEMSKYFDFAPRQRRYLCPECASSCSDVGLEFNLAQLRPNSPTSTNIYCICCDSNTEVLRDDCTHSDCLGNVIYEDQCLTCTRRLN